MTIEEKTGLMLNYLMNHILPEERGSKFVFDAVAILTLCLTGIINECSCGKHKEELIKIAIGYIKKDLEL